MKIIKSRTRTNTIYYSVYFEWKGQSGSGAGFSFECDKYGKVTKESEQKENYQKCINKEHDVDGPFYREFGSNYVEPAVGICDDCGEEVMLDSFTNTCDCGADYNMSGQKLADRSQWSEDTNEHLSDILRIK